MRLSPQPGLSQLDRYYPSSYWYSPEPDAADRLSERYRRLVLRDHINFVRRSLKSSEPAGLILDVGCGGGLFLKLLGERGHRVIGLDSSEEAARIAWRRNGVPVVRASLSEVPLSAESCAAITMFHVLEHLHEPLRYLQAAHRLLKRNGRLIIQVPNASSWQFLLLGENWNGLDVPRHLFNYRGLDLERLLAKSGFEVLRRKHFSLRDNPAGLATSLAPTLDPMARRLRALNESGTAKLLKDGAYFAMVVAALPFTLLEAAFGAGSTIMIEARKR